MTSELVDPQEAITPLEGLRLYTSSAAIVEGRSDIGVIEAGRRANFAILSADPTSVPDEDIGSIHVLETWMDGELIFESPDARG
jgi:hypothetical protein